MPVTIWEVTTAYDRSVETHTSSITRLYHEAYAHGLTITWRNGKSTPINWLGYNELNPSPGYPIDINVWSINNEDDAMMFHLLYGCKIVEVSI